MPRSDPVQGITTPLGSELPDGAAMSASIVDQIVLKSDMRFATTTARDTAIPSGSRKAGMVSFLDANGRLETVLVDAGAWVPLSTRDVFVGTETAVFGASPPAGTLKIRKDISQVVTTGAGGNCSQLFPGGAFPNGLVNYSLAVGDLAGGLGFLVPNPGGVAFSLSGWQATAYQPGGATVGSGAGIRVQVSAVGW